MTDHLLSPTGSKWWGAEADVSGRRPGCRSQDHPLAPNMSPAALYTNLKTAMDTKTEGPRTAAYNEIETASSPDVGLFGTLDERIPRFRCVSAPVRREPYVAQAPSEIEGLRD